MILRALLATSAITASGLAVGDLGGDHGRQEYEASCALCHGSSGKDDGSFSFLIELATLDLTTLSSKNGGVFPAERVHAVIDGREKIKAHGPGEMPIWDKRFTTLAMKNADDFPLHTEKSAQRRIAVLIDYLNRLQVK